MPITKKPPITEDFEAKGNSVYGCTKYIGELYVKKHTPHIILRYAHLYGKEKRMHGLVGGFLDRITRGLEPTLFGGIQSNDFTYIKDIAQANYKTLISSWDKWNNIYNIGTGEEITAQTAGETICRVWGYEGKVDTKEQRTIDAERFVYSIDKAKLMLGYEPQFTFEQGLEDMKGLMK
jgi:nucleoside-diphosphate-sugar epimerase